VSLEQLLTCIMQSIFSASAICDLENIWIYYTEQQVPLVGETLISAIISHIETLAANLLIGRQVSEFAMQAIKELIHSPFRIVYVLETTNI